MVILNLTNNKYQCQAKVNSKTSLLTEHQSSWAEHTLNDIQQLICDTQSQIVDISHLLTHDTKPHDKRFKGMVKRKADHLIETNRLRIHL